MNRAFSQSRFIRTWLPVVLAGSCAIFGVFQSGAASEVKTGASFVENFDRIDTARWYVSDGWTNGAHQNCTWSRDMVSVVDGILKVGFAARPYGDRDYSCGEIQTNKRFGYGTYEVRMKTVAGKGLNSAFFNYIGPAQSEQWDEIDFEILGKDPSQVQLNYYVSGKGGHEKFAPVPDGAAESFNTYAFVWEPNRLRWYVNGSLVHTIEGTQDLPDTPSKIFVSLWGSDTEKAWLGSFAAPSGPVDVSVDWLAFTALGEACQFSESVACSLN